MDNFFDLDVNALFEQYSIKEIENLNKKIQNTVDGKKEELRTMVIYCFYLHLSTIYTLF